MYVSDFEYNYVGCFIDDASRDMDGLQHDGTTVEGNSNGENGDPPPFFGAWDTPSKTLFAETLLSVP